MRATAFSFASFWFSSITGGWEGTDA